MTLKQPKLMVEMMPTVLHRYYYRQMLTKMKMSNRHVIFKKHEGEDDSLVTLDRLIDELVIKGTVNEVVDQILAIREQAGDFGEIVYAGMDLVDPQLGTHVPWS
jgi:uncharacterized protein YqgQ